MEEKDEKEDLEELYKDKGEDDHDDLEDFFEEVKEDEKKDNKMLFIIGGVILGIILLVVVLLLVFGGSKNSNNNGNNGNNNNNNQNNNSNNGKEENNKNDDLDEDEIDNRERIPRTEKKMIVYMIGNEFVEDSYVKEEDRKNKATVGINIEDLDAKVLDIYPRTEYKKGEFPKYILYLDAGKVKYFSVSEFKSRNLAINATYNKYRMLVVEDSFKAIYYKKAKENGIYNLSTKKYLYKDTYKSFAIIGDNLLEAEKKDDTKKYTLLLSEEKVIGDSSDGSTTVTFGKFMAKVKDGLYTVYDSKYNVLAEGIKENEIYQDGDTICVAKKGTVYKYDLNGKELDHSIGNDEIAFITKDYYVSVNGTGFKLMELVGSYPLMDEQMNGYVINPKYSGLKDKSDKSSQTGKGIYIYLEGTTVDKEYFYNLNTGESSSTKINK